MPCCDEEKRRISKKLILLKCYDAQGGGVEVESGTKGVVVQKVLGTDVKQRLARGVLILDALPCPTAQHLDERVGDGTRTVHTGEIDVAGITVQLGLDEILDGGFGLLLLTTSSQQQHDTYYIYTFIEH